MEIEAKKLYLPTTNAKLFLRQMSKTILSISREVAATFTTKSKNNHK
jgi:hypothetical protein